METPGVQPLLRGSSFESIVTDISTPSAWGGSPVADDTPDTSSPASRSESPGLEGPDVGVIGLRAFGVDTQSVSMPIVHNICFVGAGFVGGPTAALIALHNAQITVNVVDLNAQRIAAWNSPHLPVHETGLLKIVRIARDGTRPTSTTLPGSSEIINLPARSPNLFFSTNVTASIAEADIIFVCVNTPTKMYGIGAGATADLASLESATKTVAQNAKRGAIVVQKSTVPCGTARMISEILQQTRRDTSFEVLSNPEFLAEGTAVANLMYPDRILIGSSRTSAGLQAAAALQSVYAAWVSRERILLVNTFSSELTKLIANAMLAQRLSSINAVSALCEELGADVGEVGRALGADSRLGPKFLKAGVGFGGSCFEKDILNLAYLSRSLHLDAVADYWLGILDINRFQRERFARTVIGKMNGTLRGKKIAVLGFAFKDGTNDTRNSVAVHIIRELAAELPREIAIFDPGCAVAEIEEEISLTINDPAELSKIKVVSGWRDAVDQAAVVCVLTEWNQFRGRQPRHPTKTKSSRPTTVAFSKHGPEISEMEIIKLEKSVSSTHHSRCVEDPLARHLPQPICGENCSQCATDVVKNLASDTVDWKLVSLMMDQPSWVFDGRAILDDDELRSLGFKVHVIGKSI